MRTADAAASPGLDARGPGDDDQACLLNNPRFSIFHIAIFSCRLFIGADDNRREVTMRHTTEVRGLLAAGPIWIGLAAFLAAGASALAEGMLRNVPRDPNQAQVYLVRQDSSDCQNSDVKNEDSPLVGGNVWVSRTPNGNTTVKVAMTAKPNTAYHFFLKCVRLLGNLSPDGEGVAIASFTFPSSAVGNVYAFDSYPEGAPAGNKFQSARVSFQ